MSKIWGIFVVILKVVIVICCIIASPLLYLIAKIIQVSGWFPIRIRGKKLQIAVQTYRHPLTKQTVVLVGNMHYGEKKYFCQLSKLLKKLENRGYRITYEMIEGSLTTLIEGEDEDESAISSDIQGMGEIIPFLVDALGLDYLSLTYKSSWKNIDITADEVVTALSSANYQARPPDELSFEAYEKNKYLYRWLFNKGLANFVVIMLFTKLVSLLSTSQRIMNSVLLVQRNGIAAEGIMESLQETGKVASFWGMEHLGGIGRILRQKGFKLDEQSWLTAYHIRPYKLPVTFR